MHEFSKHPTAQQPHQQPWIPIEALQRLLMDFSERSVAMPPSTHWLPEQGGPSAPQRAPSPVPLQPAENKNIKPVEAAYIEVLGLTTHGVPLLRSSLAN